MTIEINNLNFKYPLQKEGLFDINLKIPKNKITLILGDNGSGKSTLVKLVDGLIFADEGEIRIDNQVISKKTAAEIKQKIGFIFQQPQNQLFADTVLKDVEFALDNFKLDKKLAPAILEKLNIKKELWNKSVFDLSLGQMKMVSIAGSLVYKPEYIIYDEPTSGLDYANQEMIINVIGEQKKEHKTQLIITHDLDTFVPLADFFIVLENGHVKIAGDFKAVFSDKNIKAPNFVEIARELKLKKLPKNIDELARLI